MSKMLVIEDDQQLSNSIVSLFQKEGFRVDCAYDGEEGLEKALATSYHVAIIDIMMPRLSGLEVIQALRQRQDKLPILILSALDRVDSRVEGLKIGADDYLVKPFSIAELKARIQALMRRADQSPRELQVADLTLNYATREVKRKGEFIELQNREFELLAFLMENQGQIVSKKMIIRDVWHFNFDPQTNIVEARMSKLRDKIDRPFEHPLIQTVRGAGYIIGASPLVIHSLTFRITLGTTLGFLLSSGLAFLFLDQVLQSALRSRTDRVLESLILELSTGLSLDQGQTVLQNELDILSLTHGSRNSVFRVFDEAEKVIAQNRSPYWSDLEQHPRPHFDADHPLFHWSSKTTQLHPAGVRWLALKTDLGPVIQIGLSLEENEDLLKKGRLIFAAAICMILLVGITGSVFMTRKGLWGLKSIGNVALGVREDLNFGQSVPLPTGCRETDQLAITFNLMLKQIQVLIQSQKDIMDNIAHDIRSPVARMRILAESQLMSGMDAELPGRIVEGCDQILDLVNTLLEISATESGTAPLNLQAINLEELVTETCDLIEPLAEQKGCELEKNLESYYVSGDIRMLQRVLSNLLDNAIKFTPVGGSIKVNAQPEGKRIRLSITNTGQGIAPDQLDHIFERFVQLDPARSQGSGLGLSFCKAALEAMGGSISCQSEMGRTTTFNLELNRENPKETESKAESESKFC